MKSFKKLHIFAVLAFVFALLVGCGDNTNNEANTNANADNNVEANVNNEVEGNNNEANNNDDAAELGGNMILATTTSTFDSGLLDVLTPMFEEQTGVNVQIISVGTGAALAMGSQGEADVLLTHAPAAEQELEDADEVINRHRVMHNDYIVLGPNEDPAGANGLSIEEAFTNIAESGSSFYSRGDDSGTHKKELQVWEDAGVSIDFAAYEEVGSGMGDTLRIAAEKGGYVLTDRGTYLSLQDELDTLSIVVEGFDELLNIYHVMQVNPELHSHDINDSAAAAFVDFMLADETQEAIRVFGVDMYDQALFFPLEK